MCWWVLLLQAQQGPANLKSQRPWDNSIPKTVFLWLCKEISSPKSPVTPIVPCEEAFVIHMAVCSSVRKPQMVKTWNANASYLSGQTKALLWDQRTVTFSFLLFSRIGNQNPPLLAQAQQNMQEFQSPNQFSPPSKHICKKIQFPHWLLCRKSTPDWDTLGRE